jgi:hypothetical protein
MSPTQRSLKLLRSQGMTVQVVERYNQFARRRIDLFGFIDIVAVSDCSIIGVQTTSGSNVSARLEKIREERRDAALAWLRAGGRIHIHGWRKIGPRGKKKFWAVRVMGVVEIDGELEAPAAAVLEEAERNATA